MKGFIIEEKKRERERWKVGVGWSVAKEDRGCTEN